VYPLSRGPDTIETASYCFSMTLNKLIEYINRILIILLYYFVLVKNVGRMGQDSKTMNSKQAFTFSGI